MVVPYLTDLCRKLLMNVSNGLHRDVVLNSGTPMERCFFHVLMMLVSCYGAMILTSWGRTDGAPVVSDVGYSWKK